MEFASHEVRAHLLQHRQQLELLLHDRSDISHSGYELGCRRAQLTDELLVPLFLQAEKKTLGPRVNQTALLAVGSYGRGAVAWGSDLDVRLVVTGAKKQAETLAEAILYPLWDAGLSVGHQVVCVEEMVELGRSDLPTATSILDARFLAGNPTFINQLYDQARQGLFCDANIGGFLQRLTDESHKRHARFGDSVYFLEPDVKNGAGGLRDLDVAWWAATSRWVVHEFGDLVRVGVLVQREAESLAAAREALWRIRNRLHQQANRRSDRLTFDQQEQLARDLGYGKGGRAVEAFMSDYYRHARTIVRLRDLLVSRAAPPVSRKQMHDEDAGRGVRLFDHQVSLADPAVLASDPALALRAYGVAIERHVPVSVITRQNITRATEDETFASTLRASSEASSLFVDLCSRAQETKLLKDSVLGDMHEAGLLVAMIPEFSPVVGRVHHDVYHVYTVDVHSVAAVDRLRALARGELAAMFPLASRLAAEISRPRVLYLATLLHDVGKAIGGKDHATRGANMVLTIGQRLGLDLHDIQQIAHLVRIHLLMYHVATRRDLDDSVTIAEFAKKVRGREGLRELYLLTVADLSTTSPTAMTRWKSKMLDELYVATDHYFAEGQRNGEQPHRGNDFDDKRVRHVRQALLTQLGHDSRHYLWTMPTRYLLSNPQEDISRHFIAVVRAESRGGLAIELIHTSGEDSLELCVVAPDRPGLLALVTAAITAARLEIHAAQIHSHSGRRGSTEAVDLFWVRGAGGEPHERPRTLARIERDLNHLFTGQITPESLLEGRNSSPWFHRPTPAVATEISFDHRLSSNHTILEIVTRNRPGLLYTLAKVLHRQGIAITLAKINTEGTRVADVFYLTESDGSKIVPGARIESLHAALLTALGEADAAESPSPPPSSRKPEWNVGALLLSRCWLLV